MRVVRQIISTTNRPSWTTEWFTHPHIDDVGQMIRATFKRRCCQVGRGVCDLGIDLAGFEVPVESELSGCAERAAERTTRLT